MRRIALVLVTFLSVSFGSGYTQAEDVVYPNFRGRNQENVFAFAVLQEALQRAPGDYDLKKTQRPEMTNARALVELERGRVDVVWVGTSPDLETRFRPVYIPITRGLLGHRLFVIQETRQAQFSKVTDIQDLQRFTGGQGTGWTDTTILNASGLDIVTASFDNLFQLVATGRVDYYPLGASEVFGFLDDYQSEYPGLAVETDLVVVYPFDFLFFVNKEDEALHNAIRRGMEMMYDDGTYIHMFRNHPELRAFHEHGALESRRSIHIHNPIATSEFRAIPERYWLRR